MARRATNEEMEQLENAVYLDYLRRAGLLANGDFDYSTPEGSPTLPWVSYGVIPDEEKKD